MSEASPETRAAVTPRSGDTHVIGAEDNAVAVNVDQAARVLRQAQDEREAAEVAKAAKRGKPDVAAAPDAEG